MSASKFPNEQNAKLIDENGLPIDATNPLDTKLTGTDNKVKLVDNTGTDISSVNGLNTVLNNAVKFDYSQNKVKITDEAGNAFSSTNGLPVAINGTPTVNIGTTANTVKIDQATAGANHIELRDATNASHVAKVDNNGSLNTKVTNDTAGAIPIKITDGVDTADVMDIAGNKYLLVTTPTGSNPINNSFTAITDDVTGTTASIVNNSLSVALNTSNNTVKIDQSTAGANHIEITQGANTATVNADGSLKVDVVNQVTPQDEADFINKNYVLYNDYIKDPSLPFPYPYADAMPPTVDPFGRQGWHYLNNWTGTPPVGQKKINWYFYDYTNVGTLLYQLDNAYALITMDKVIHRPYFYIYAGNPASPTTYVYNTTTTTTFEVGKTYLFWFGNVAPTVFPEYDRVEFTTGSTVNPSLPLLQIALTTDSNHGANTVEFQTYALGYKTIAYQATMRLQMKEAGQLVTINDTNPVNVEFASPQNVKLTDGTDVAQIDTNGRIGTRIYGANIGDVVDVSGNSLNVNVTNQPSILNQVRVTGNTWVSQRVSDQFQYNEFNTLANNNSFNVYNAVFGTIYKPTIRRITISATIAGLYTFNFFSSTGAEALMFKVRMIAGETQWFDFDGWVSPYNGGGVKVYNNTGNTNSSAVTCVVEGWEQ